MGSKMGKRGRKVRAKPRRQSSAETILGIEYRLYQLRDAPKRLQALSERIDRVQQYLQDFLSRERRDLINEIQRLHRYIPVEIWEKWNGKPGQAARQQQ